MDLLQFLVDEGFCGIMFNSGSKEKNIGLDELESNEQLFETMSIRPLAVQYFPYEKEPYMVCTSKETNRTIKLIKTRSHSSVIGR
ncbi:hypothetical protein [Halobacillus yeomjeoni]|uniref:Uncharacterized protein n=1 Tax=Halobacillus yeomjeoni TaxID=311194 RepID=A0A931HTB0_9BACI|nr:hypothetical protein [Halobacillus yeomjeoni]MBH0229164.1 hypothetical protein [Halobacillus yeomjeoni]